MNKHLGNQTDKQRQLEAAASKWTDLVLAHVRAKRLGINKQRKINKKHKYAK